MKECITEKRNVTILKEVICDNCGESCKNTYTDIILKHSFSEKEELLKTICWKCYDKEYSSDYHKFKELRFQQTYAKARTQATKKVVA